MGTGRWNLHLRLESLIHVSKFREDFSTADLFFIKLGNSGSIGRQTGERNNLLSDVSGSTAISTLNNRDLRNAKSFALSDKDMLHLVAFFRFLLGKLGKLDSLLLLLLLGLDLLTLLLVLLLLLNLLLLRKSRARLLLNSEGKSSSFSSLGDTTLSRDSFITLILVAVTTESLQFSVSQSGVLNLNSLSIIDNSAEGSLNNKNIIIGSKNKFSVSVLFLINQASSKPNILECSKI